MQENSRGKMMASS